MPIPPSRRKPEPIGLGINLYDVERMHPDVRKAMLGGKLCLDKSKVVWVDRSVEDDTCVPFLCDLLTAAAVCDQVRSEDRRAGRVPTRVYQLRKAWQRLPPGLLLCVMADGKLRLNWDAFPDEVELLAPTPPPVRKL